jgi:hypothetical protein
MSVNVYARRSCSSSSIVTFGSPNYLLCSTDPSSACRVLQAYLTRSSQGEQLLSQRHCCWPMSSGDSSVDRTRTRAKSKHRLGNMRDSSHKRSRAIQTNGHFRFVYFGNTFSVYLVNCGVDCYTIRRSATDRHDTAERAS